MTLPGTHPSVRLALGFLLWAGLTGCRGRATPAASPPERPPSVEARLRPPPPDPELRQAVERIVAEDDLLARPWVFGWPLQQVDISSPYGVRMHPVVRRLLFHAGIDFQVPRGEPILSAGPGVVVQAETLPLTGKTVVVEHPGKLMTLYAHLDELLVFPGETVEGGAPLGLVGSTGRSTGPHLHFTVYRTLGRERHPVDPTLLLGTVVDPVRPPVPWPAEIYREKGVAEPHGPVAP